MARRIGFIIAILIGLAAGLYYGWVVNPVNYVDTTIDTLRPDYQTDYVLMVAEAYHASGDLDLAARRLAQFGDEEPVLIARQAHLLARQYGYSAADLVLLDEMALAFQTWTPQPAYSTTLTPGLIPEPGETPAGTTPAAAAAAGGAP
jgi:hypothetical protein